MTKPMPANSENAMEGWEGFGVFLIGTLVTAYIALRGETRALAILREWAAANGLRVVSARRRWFSWRYWWRGDAQRLYDVVFADQSGRQRSASVLVGGYILGNLSPRVHVDWH